MKNSDAFIVLPGGVGSMDELFEIMASNQLGIINKPLGILNTDGYYNHLILWLKKAVEEGFISKKNLNELIIEDDPERLLNKVLMKKVSENNDWKDRLGL